MVQKCGKLKKILVFGSSGFFGSNFLKMATESGSLEIVCVSRQHKQISKLPNVSFATYDKATLEDKRLHNIDYVIDL